MFETKSSCIIVSGQVIPVSQARLGFTVTESGVGASGEISGRIRVSTTKPEVVECLKSGQYIAPCFIWFDTDSKPCRGDFHLTNFTVSVVVDDVACYIGDVESVGDVEYLVLEECN